MKILVLLTFGMSLLFGAVDINTANTDELSSLNGIGSKKASAIIEYRKSNCFESVEAITDVKGIGESFLEKNRDNLTASECKPKP